MENEVYSFTNPSNRLKIIRIVLGFKQEIFAKFMGIGLSTLRNWERKEIYLSLKIKDRFRYVGISPQWIDYGTGEPLLIEKKMVIKNIINFKS